MKERLRRFMAAEAVNSTQLASTLEIQASGISHILSGRNKPSYDFVSKLLVKFPNLNPDWLLLGKGPMHRDEIRTKATPIIGKAEAEITPQPQLPIEQETPHSPTEHGAAELDFGESIEEGFMTEKNNIPNREAKRAIKRVIVVYTDGTFDAYTPSSGM